MSVCRLCGRDANACGGWLERVNEKGVPGVWECRPSCGADLSGEEKVLGAILSFDKKKTSD
jgi:hypothetical protein